MGLEWLLRKTGPGASNHFEAAVSCAATTIQDDVYGLNDSGSLIYMGCLYVVALGIYVGSRLVRRRQGIDMAMVHKEIPAE
ncbi:MAG: hypothetical protein ACRDL4_07500 [Thermoleophilaceae bacterium]